MTTNIPLLSKYAIEGWTSACGLLLILVLIPLSASAQSAPSGIMKQSTATSGSTDVATSTFEGAAARDDANKSDATEAKILAGGLAASGNARSIAATTSAQFRMRRSANQGNATGAINYGRSASAPTATDDHPAMKTSVENYQGKIRYDRFLSERFTVFGALSLRRDRFQGLNLRLNLDPGVAYYFVSEPKQLLWGELGYDLQFDIRAQKAIDAAEDEGDTLDKNELRHSGRLFAGYSNNLLDQIGFNTGLEYLQGIPETTNWRINWDLGVTSKIAGNFSLAVTFNLKYDHNPLPSVAHTDTTTAVSLVYQLI